MKNGADKTAFLEAWSNQAAINQVPTALTDIVSMAEESVTLADVRAVWGPGAATTIVVELLKGLFYFSEAEKRDAYNAETQRKATQLMETAGLIVDEFYFLTMPELCSFFRRVKTGMYGQISWGSLGINVQQLFSVMREFQRDRKAAYDKLEAERQKNESLERRCKDYAGAIIGGIEGHYQKCRDDFDYFCQAFPVLLGGEHARAWWEYFKKDQNKAISDLFNLKTIK